MLLLGLGMLSDRRAAFVHSLPYYWGFLPEQTLLSPRGLDPPFSGAWSLGIEEKFYFVWPILGFVLLAGRFRPRIGVLLGAIVLFACGPVIGPVGHLVQPYALIAMGCLAALLLDDERWYARLRRLGDARVLVPLLVAMAVVQVAVPAIQLGHALYVVHGVPVTAVLIGLVITESGAVGWLSSRPMVFLGRISYAFYLTHNFALNAAQGALPAGVGYQAGVAVVVALGLAIGIAWVLHVTLERPLTRLGHRLSARRSAASAPKIAA